MLSPSGNRSELKNHKLKFTDFLTCGGYRGTKSSRMMRFGGETSNDWGSKMAALIEESELFSGKYWSLFGFRRTRRSSSRSETFEFESCKKSAGELE